MFLALIETVPTLLFLYTATVDLKSVGVNMFFKRRCCRSATCLFAMLCQYAIIYI